VGLKQIGGVVVDSYTSETRRPEGRHPAGDVIVAVTGCGR